MMPMTKPFLKYLGGKSRLLHELLPRIPSSFNKFSEPFCGGAALFFALQPQKAEISDINLPLIITYNVVKDDIEGLLNLLRYHDFMYSRHNDYYYIMRDYFNHASITNRELAAAFIFLNKTCYNGLWRVNKSGEMNVPKGKYKNPKIYDEDTLRLASSALQGVNIVQKDYHIIEKRRNDFFYFDPPYAGTFSQYDSSGFTEEDHKYLRSVCDEIQYAGGFFMVSNSDSPFVRNEYRHYNIEEIYARRSASCDGTQRGKTKELIVRNYE